MPQLTQPSMLARTFSEVLANLAFMFVTEPPPGQESGSVSLGADALQVEIGFEGPSRGRLTLRCGQPFASALAANLLGVDAEEELAHSHCCDAVKELMNVVCGQLVTAQYGRQAVFHLTIPEVRTLDELEAATPLDAPETLTVYVDGHGVLLGYRGD